MTRPKHRIALAVLAVLLVAGCGGGGSPGKSQIVRWTSIGDASLGDSRREIRHAFGKPFASSRMDQTQLAGTKYAGREITAETYRVPGNRGLLYVRYLDGVAKELGTDSARYSTDDGIRVGKTIARGPCRRNSAGSCTYRWHGFAFDDCTNGFVLSRRNLVIEIGLDRSLYRYRSGRVRWIGFGDPDVVLHCF